MLTPFSPIFRPRSNSYCAVAVFAFGLTGCSGSSSSSEVIAANGSRYDCGINAVTLQNDWGVITNDNQDDTSKLQAALDAVRSNCPSTSSKALFELPDGIINTSLQLRLWQNNVDYRGQGSDLSAPKWTKIVLNVKETARYNFINDEFDLQQLKDPLSSANGTWLTPGYAAIRVESKKVDPKLKSQYEAAADSDKDLFIGSSNLHWLSNSHTLAKDAAMGDRQIFLDNVDNFKVGDFVEVRAANTHAMYDRLETPIEARKIAPHLLSQIFEVVKVDSKTLSIEINSPLEFDMVIDASSEALPGSGSSVYSKVVKLDVVNNISLSDFFLTQIVDGVDATDSRYGTNLALDQAYIGVLYKYVANSSISNVRTSMTGSHALALESTYRIKARSNLFSKAWNLGPGLGYVRIARSSQPVLDDVEIDSLRHLAVMNSTTQYVLKNLKLNDTDFNMHGGGERTGLLTDSTIRMSAGPYGGRGPLFWSAGAQATWASASGGHHALFNVEILWQKSIDTDFQTLPHYTAPGVLYQIGAGGMLGDEYMHLQDELGQPIQKFDINTDYSDRGVNIDCRYDGSTGLLEAKTLECAGNELPLFDWILNLDANP